MYNNYNSYQKFSSKSGNVADYFQNIKSIIEVNDGTRSFILRTVDSHDRPPPFDDGQETQLSITHEDHDISQLSEGFITFDVELQLQLLGLDATFDDPDELLQIFVGWKSSNQIMDRYLLDGNLLIKLWTSYKLLIIIKQLVIKIMNVFEKDLHILILRLLVKRRPEGISIHYMKM